MSDNEIRTSPRPTCFLCGVEGSVLYSGVVDRLFEAPGIWNLKQCPNSDCRLIWVDPAPVEEDIGLAYKHYFTHSDDKAAGGSARGRLLLYSAYRTLTAVSSCILGLRASQEKRKSMYLDALTPGRVLDVGCGDGRFLKRMQDRGWRVDGVDFDKGAIQTAKLRYGLDLRHGSLEEAGFERGSFEAVTLSHSIEHVFDPVAVLRFAAKLLKPGGRIVVTTPNSASYGQKRFNTCWLGLDPPRHVHVFTLNSLEKCAVKAGLRRLQLFSTAATADILLGGSLALLEFGDHRGSHLPRPNINISRAVRAYLLQAWENLHIRRAPDCGEEAVGIFEVAEKQT